MPDQLIEQGLDPLVEEAQSHGYLTVDGDRITYHCGREYSDNYGDPEEKVHGPVRIAGSPLDGRTHRIV